jgi:hypothetical protein
LFLVCSYKRFWSWQGCRAESARHAPKCELLILGQRHHLAHHQPGDPAGAPSGEVEQAVGL